MIYLKIEDFLNESKNIPKYIKIYGKKRPCTNSEGDYIHTTLEGIKNFYDWFGDSLMVDEQGRPRVCYHGNNKSFNILLNRQLGLKLDKNKTEN
jgi:hypothetical protein